MLKRIKWDTFIKKVLLFKCLERDRTARRTQTRRNRGQEVPEQLPSSLGGTYIYYIGNIKRTQLQKVVQTRYHQRTRRQEDPPGKSNRTVLGHGSEFHLQCPMISIFK